MNLAGSCPNGAGAADRLSIIRRTRSGPRSHHHDAVPPAGTASGMLWVMCSAVFGLSSTAAGCPSQSGSRVSASRAPTAVPSQQTRVVHERATNETRCRCRRNNRRVFLSNPGQTRGLSRSIATASYLTRSMWRMSICSIHVVTAHCASEHDGVLKKRSRPSSAAGRTRLPPDAIVPVEWNQAGDHLENGGLAAPAGPTIATNSDCPMSMFTPAHASIHAIPFDRSAGHPANRMCGRSIFLLECCRRKFTFDMGVQTGIRSRSRPESGCGFNLA